MLRDRSAFSAVRNGCPSMRIILKNSFFTALLLAALLGGTTIGRTAEAGLDANLEHARASLMLARTNVKNVPVNASGIATFSTSSLQTGSHTVTAAYASDTNFAASMGSVLQSVQTSTGTTTTTAISSKRT